MRGLVICALWIAGCGESHTGDDAGMDAGRERFDAGVEEDAGRDAGRDAGDDAGDDAGPFDAGMVTCMPESCAASVCGRSFCGAPCGECPIGWYCAAGSCRDPSVTPAPGDFCVDAFGENVVEGGRSFRECPVDPSMLQSCQCSGGGPSAWIACGDCQRVVLAGARGDRCASADQCGGVPCHPTLRLCGERCDRGLGVVCPAGTACGIPGDIAGACLPTCTACDTGCSEDAICRRGDGDTLVCAPSGYGWASNC